MYRLVCIETLNIALLCTFEILILILLGISIAPLSNEGQFIEGQPAAIERQPAYGE